MYFSPEQLEKLLLETTEEMDRLLEAHANITERLQVLGVTDAKLGETLELARIAEDRATPRVQRCAIRRMVNSNMVQLSNFLREKQSELAQPDHWLLNTVDWEQVDSEPV